MDTLDSGIEKAQAAVQSTKDISVTPEAFELASQDVSAYVDTAHDDKAARAALAKEMREKAKSNPEYRAALQRITPDLSELTNSRTTVQQRENLYEKAVEMLAEQYMNDPERRDELARMSQEQGPEQLPLGQIAVMSLQDEQKFRAALDKGDEALANAIQQNAAAEFAKEKDVQISMLETANASINGQAKLYLPRDNGKYTGKILEINDRYALQQLRESNSFVAHPVDKLKGQQLTAGERLLMEYKDGELAVKSPEQIRTIPEQGRARDADRKEQVKSFNSELVQLKNEHAGKDAKLVMAKDENGKAYTGTIIAETGDKVLQRVSDKYVVVHEKSKLARDVEVGSNKTLAYESGKISVLEPSQDRNRSRFQEAQRSGEKILTPEQERRDSFFQARNIIISQFGDASKVRDAKTDIGDYKGAIVVITKNHVAQQLGANSFVVHEKDRLAGSYHKGTHVQIKYDNGRALSVLTQRQKEQSREHAQDRGVSR